jgi:glucose-6-phosphate 1-dehydrogenase
MNLFLFGSTGDLVKRKILPALNEMNPKNLELFAIGRRDFIDDIYKNFACFKDCIIKDKIHYFKADFEKGEICEECEKNLKKNKVNYFYVPLPPELYPIILKKISTIKKKGYQVKFLLEKPFGNSLENAKELFDLIKKLDLEDEFFLADHYLFKEEIKKLEKRDFKKLKICSIENVGLENRVSFYDNVGALKDMVQSHLLNIVLKLMDEVDFEKLEVVEFKKRQYEDYEKELKKKSGTETFVKVKLRNDKSEVEIVTGKKFLKKQNVLFIDDKKIDFEKGDAYIEMLKKFFNNEKEFFPEPKKVLLAWELIEKIEKRGKEKKEIKKYKDNLDWEEVC